MSQTNRDLLALLFVLLTVPLTWITGPLLPTPLVAVILVTYVVVRFWSRFGALLSYSLKRWENDTKARIEYEGRRGNNVDELAAHRARHEESLTE